MPKLIVTSRYLKAGSKKHIRDYVKYIATRQGSVPTASSQAQAPATKNQQELLKQLIADYPDSTELFEYEDYQKAPTVQNASKLISEILDRNMDRLTNRENYVGYLANRPGAVRFGTHGLFNGEDKPIDLDRVAREIANHKGNVWTHVVSLRRDNAQQMGYDNLTAWLELVKRQIPNIAEQSKIDMKNLRWYAAFHDKLSNPHVHIIVYSVDPRQGFLTKQGIEKIRSGFSNDIYHDELYNLYSKQTSMRDLIKKESAELMHRLAQDMSSGDTVSDELITLIGTLKTQLDSSKGKKVYGYLKPEVKKTVDDIFAQLAQNESIQKMYKLWCEMEQQKHDVYSSAKVTFPPLVDNHAFKSVKNMIIKTVIEMNTPIIAEEEAPPPEPTAADSDDDTPPPIDYGNELSPDDFVFDSTDAVEIDTGDYISESKYTLKWSDDYKSACKLIYAKHSELEDYKEAEKLLQSEAAKGNALAIHDLGKLYATDKLGAKDEDKSAQFYEEALAAFMDIEPNADFMFPYEPKFPGQTMKPQDMRSYVWYRIGKMHCYGLGTEQDYAEAFRWFEKSAMEGNKFAQFSLANLYYYGNGTDQSYEQACHWYMAASNQGQPYAAYALAQMYANGEYVSKDKSEADRYYKQALAGFLKLEADDQADDNLLYKIGRMFKLGLGTAEDKEKALDYFKRSAALNNKNGLYEYGKALLLGEGVVKDTEQGEKLLQKAIALGNDNAKRFLALEYISGENVEQDIDKGIDMLIELADSGDTMSAYKLGKIYLSGDLVFTDLDKAEKYLQQAADDDNEYAIYSLAKLYLLDDKKDLAKAVKWLEKACEHESIKPYAAYTYAKILLDDNEFHDAAKAIELLEDTADENNWCAYLLGKLYLFGNDDVEKDKQKAIEWLTKSAEDGNAYAEALLQHSEDYERSVMTSTVMSLFAHLARIIEDDYMRSHRKLQSKVDRKLRRIIEQKKEDLGIKSDGTIHYDY